MDYLSADAVFGLLLYLIGIPTIVTQFVPEDVVYVTASHKSTLFIRKFLVPIAIGVLIWILSWIFPLIFTSLVTSTVAPNIVLLLLLAVVAYETFVAIPTLSREAVVSRITKRIIARLQSEKILDEDDISDLVFIGTASQPGDQKNISLKAISVITKTVLSLPNYEGCQMEGIINAIRSIVIEGKDIGTPENFYMAFDILRQIIDKYYKTIKIHPTLSDSDLAQTYKLLSEMGQVALGFPVDGVSFTSISTIGSYDTLNPAASQRLSEIGAAATKKDRMGVAMNALHKLEFAINNSEKPVEDEILYDYVGMLGAFWCHGESAQKQVKQNLDDLKERANLRKLVSDSIHHHSRVSRFTVADHIRAMWDGYQRLA